MTHINATSLKKGMLFSAPLFFDDEKNMFLAERFPVERFHLETIKRWRIRTLCTFGEELDSSQIKKEVAVEEVEILDELEEIEDAEDLEELEELEEI